VFERGQLWIHLSQHWYCLALPCLLSSVQELHLDSTRSWTVKQHLVVSTSLTDDQRADETKISATNIMSFFKKQDTIRACSVIPEPAGIEVD
jgi:hypothetical protein